jgi:hypothetical protein
MAQKYSEISEKIQQFIEKQKIFFVGTATVDSRVNISPKGMDSLKVLDKNRVVWLNVTGSGNETAAHVAENPRMTIMFAAFAEEPTILRLYGTAKAIHRNDPEWNSLVSLFAPLAGARQIFDVSIDLVQTSCGLAVPFYEYVSDRESLNNWATKKGNSGIEEYWKQKNQTSLDGKPTKIVEKNI